MSYVLNKYKEKAWKSYRNILYRLKKSADRVEKIPRVQKDNEKNHRKHTSETKEQTIELEKTDRTN